MKISALLVTLPCNQVAGLCRWGSALFFASALAGCHIVSEPEDNAPTSQGSESEETSNGPPRTSDLELNSDLGSSSDSSTESSLDEPTLTSNRPVTDTGLGDLDGGVPTGATLTLVEQDAAALDELDAGGSDSAAAAQPSLDGSSPETDTRGVWSEDCALKDDNDDMEHAQALGAGAKLCVPLNDEDWVYLDTPDDGKTHIWNLDVLPSQGFNVQLDIIAGADSSKIGSIYRSSLIPAHVVLGPNTRTYAVLHRFVGAEDGQVTLTSSTSLENDVYTPNADVDHAARIATNTDIVAQRHRPYTSLDDHPSVDWYAMELEAGPHTIVVSHVPDDRKMQMVVRGPALDIRGNEYADSYGELFEVPFTADEPGTYSLQVGDFADLPSSFYVGDDDDSLLDTYTFQVVE